MTHQFGLFAFLDVAVKIIPPLVIACDKLAALRVGADDYITMTIHMAIDRIEDQMELARLQSPSLLEELGSMTPPLDNSELEKVVAKLEQLCSEAASGQSWTSPLLQE